MELAERVKLVHIAEDLMNVHHLYDMVNVERLYIKSPVQIDKYEDTIKRFTKLNNIKITKPVSMKDLSSLIRNLPKLRKINTQLAKADFTHIQSRCLDTMLKLEEERKNSKTGKLTLYLDNDIDIAEGNNLKSGLFEVKRGSLYDENREVYD